jgi:predicted lipid-binding transport protein (Tim44 family)
MKLKMRRLPRIPLRILALAGTVAIASAAPDNPPSADPSSNQDASQSPEYKQTQEATQRYIEAYNKGDVKALAEFYAEDVDYIDQDGAETKGREADTTQTWLLVRLKQPEMPNTPQSTSEEPKES